MHGGELEKCVKSKKKAKGVQKKLLSTSSQSSKLIDNGRRREGGIGRRRQKGEERRKDEADVGKFSRRFSIPGCLGGRTA